MLDFQFLAFGEIQGEVQMSKYQHYGRKESNDESHLEEASAVLSPR